MSMHRAYTTFEIKSIDDDARVIEGIASTPTPDRGGDEMDSKGAMYSLPMPFLWKHKEEIGDVFEATQTSAGIHIKARIARIEEAGRLKERLDEAWQSIKAKLVRGLSIGWRPVEAIPNKFGGLKVAKWEWFETSAVTIPMNSEATIARIKSLDAPHLAVSGNKAGAPPSNTPVVSGTPVVRLLPSRSELTMKSIAEQIAAFTSTREQKYTELSAIITKSGDAGQTPDAAESEQADTLEGEVAALDKHITRLKSVEALQKSAAVPVAGGDPHAASATRGGQAVASVRIESREEPGIGFARAVLCKTASFLSQGMHSPLAVAEARYPNDTRVQEYLKAAIPAGTTTGVTWAAPFIDPTNLASEFIEFLRPMTLIGKFGTGNVPSLRRVPFNVRILGQTSGGDAYWVGEGAPKPVTKFDFNAQTVGWHKVAAIAVITEELARFSTPSAERIVRDSLAAAVTARVDIDLLDPTTSAVTGVNPASLTNGLTALSPSGVTADAARADVAKLVKTYLDNNNNVGSLVLAMPASLGLSLSVMMNSLGQQEFNSVTMNGGSLMGIPVITSQYLANQSGAGNLLVAINANDVLLADDGQVTVDASREASIQMLDNPTNSSATATATTSVSLWQTNSIGLKAERYISWAKARTTAVVYMDDVNWGSIGSPA